jgi:hypothetical protein
MSTDPKLAAAKTEMNAAGAMINDAARLTKEHAKDSVAGYPSGPSTTDRIKESVKDTAAQVKEKLHNATQPDLEDRLRATRANMK